ncbi:MAG: phage Gp37/Gp68 family protein [Holophaga sp.]|jgi:protein gp37
MAIGSTIEWTEATWNPVTGCTKISEGCRHCYAETLAKRLKAMGQPNYVNGFQVTLQPHMLEIPLGWRRPRNIFVNSMSDLFHEEVPSDYIQKVFAVMRKAHWHHFQILTKRSSRLAELSSQLDWSPNIWMGVSVEDQNVISRIAHLRETGAAIKFISFEPLIGPIRDLDLQHIDWVIVGGESGIGARPMATEWVQGIHKVCVTNSVPFFFKQWGGINKKKTGRLLDGQLWDEMPSL